MDKGAILPHKAATGVASGAKSPQVAPPSQGVAVQGSSGRLSLIFLQRKAAKFFKVCHLAGVYCPRKKCPRSCCSLGHTCCKKVGAVAPTFFSRFNPIPKIVNNLILTY